MKKTILSLGLLSAMAFAANAQDAATAPAASDIKAGNVTVELNMSSPFSGGGSDPFTLSNNVLRFRYFMGETTAIRLGFSIDRSGFNNTYGVKTETSNTAGTGTTTDNMVNLKSSMFQFSIMPGVEKHVMVSERLSAYYGGYIELTSNSQKSKAEVTSGSNAPAGGTSTNNFDGSYTKEWKGGMLEAPEAADVKFATATGLAGVNKADGNGFFRFGLIGVVGADYYFTKGLYLGVEAGWGLTSTSYKALEVTTTSSARAVGAAESTTTIKATDLEKNKSGLQLAPFANGAFRFGFRF